MVINSTNINTLTDLATTSLSATILNINLKNYEINKKILALGENNNSNELLLEIIPLLQDIKNNQLEIIKLLKS